MPLDCYEDLYREALSLEKGSIVEIGPARGAGTVVLGLAAKRNSGIELVISIDAFRDSRALKSFDDVEENIAELKRNLAYFGCGDEVTIMTAGHEDWELIRSCGVAMLVIDADGSLDRDFSNYYNLLPAGATVFVDDCALTLNKYARTRNTRERTGFSDDPIEDAGPSLEKQAPLGKEYLTTCFIDYMVKEGFLEKAALRGNMLTLRKCGDARAFGDDDFTRMQSIREGMKSRLLVMRAETMAIARALEPVLRQVRDEARCSEVVAYSSIPVGDVVRYYPIYGIGTDDGRATPAPEFFAKDAEDVFGDDGEVVLFKSFGRRGKRHALLLRGRGESQGTGLPHRLNRKVKQALNDVETRTERYFDSLDLEVL